ncbi:MAG: DNA mismatch repair endonuclease MutL [Bacteroidota bacterium]|nr:DNA mismatch repair endonuclease MutL [Bacteroidota bacterium]
MPDIIHLLPDSIANQIAAGEVIQRPASVVKELVENALDAGATRVTVHIKGAGRTLIQVIDDGKGMSPTDARMAFERHATSKIREAADLFALTTMGFRGEALPSIAAIAQVEVKSRRAEDELGTLLVISGSKVEKQEVIACAVGTSISVKNIFYNVPARRKFLKSNETERRHILTEVERVALVHPDIEFTLVENDLETLYLPKTGLRQRIVQMEGKHVNQQLIEIEEETTLGKIHGYVSRPEFAKKTKASQFFFVNNRFIRHPYFHKAVLVAFENLIAANEKPTYFIYFQVDPDALDVNIHPTKTEVKFENEQALWQILMVTVKEALGRFNAVPTIDFDTDDAPDIPIFDPSRSTSMPKVSLNPDYNPFRDTASGDHSRGGQPFGYQSTDHLSGDKFPSGHPSAHRSPGDHPFASKSLDWKRLYDGFEREGTSPGSLTGDMDGEGVASQEVPETEFFPEHYQYKQKYILTSVKSGLMIIDQHRAHVRILFDRYLEQIQSRRGVSQRVLFPEVLELSAAEDSAFPTVKDDLEALGFELSEMGNRSYAIQGVPSEIENGDFSEMIKGMIHNSMETGSDVKTAIQESIALSLANMTAIPRGRILTSEEMLLMVSQLFACKMPNYTPDGRVVVCVVSDKEIERKMS